ncbi:MULTISPECIES: hypothetical protein [Pseudomonas]|jgi:hypothetical protein|uniref:Uncharacterized protein n=2 Tax=Pseudomonas TaxID=286 RepID=A0A7X1GKF2_9PSED|nr:MULTISPECIES: hypothetical protein [Pseudomonas]MBC2693358.1 hypothetical protein [Pseudomonas kielensis]MDD1010992.1 hypothetical protein [Pseudomonas shahriarae]
MQSTSEAASTAGPASNECKPSEPGAPAASIGLNVWLQVQETDPDLTKSFNKGGFQGTAVSPTYQAMRATQIFGPHGLGWGTELISESYVEGGPLGFDKDGRLLGREIIHKVYLELWYIYGGKRGSIKQFGATSFLSRDAYGTISSDEDHAKKSVTDATSKCLSLLGFSADVYMGKFDDHKYVTGLKAKMEAAGSPATGMTSTETATTADSQHQNSIGSTPVGTELSSRYLGYKTRLQEFQDKGQQVGNIPAARAQIEQDAGLTQMEIQTLLQSPLLRIADASQEPAQDGAGENAAPKSIFL